MGTPAKSQAMFHIRYITVARRVPSEFETCAIDVAPIVVVVSKHYRTILIHILEPNGVDVLGSHVVREANLCLLQEQRTVSSVQSMRKLVATTRVVGWVMPKTDEVDGAWPRRFRRVVDRDLTAGDRMNLVCVGVPGDIDCWTVRDLPSPCHGRGLCKACDWYSRLLRLWSAPVDKGNGSRLHETATDKGQPKLFERRGGS